jgi:very-short-patch-repair endonuclease
MLNERARSLRRNSTDAEKRMWHSLRDVEGIGKYLVPLKAHLQLVTFSMKREDVIHPRSHAQ